jgi:hypothetical protein
MKKIEIEFDTSNSRTSIFGSRYVALLIRPGIFEVRPLGGSAIGEYKAKYLAKYTKEFLKYKAGWDDDEEI